jgi:MFS family permease
MAPDPFISRRRPRRPRTVRGASPLGMLLKFLPILLAHAAVYAVRVVPGMRRDEWRAEFALDDAASGGNMAAFIVAYILFAPFAGALLDGGRTALSVCSFGSLISAASAMLVATGTLGGDWPTFLAARFMGGAGAALVALSGPEYAAVACAGDARLRAAAFAAFYACVPLGVAAGSAAAAFSPDWRSAMAPVAAFTMATCVASYLTGAFGERVARSPDAQENGETPAWGPTLRAIAANRRFCLLTTGGALAAFGVGAVAAWAPNALARCTSGRIGTSEAALASGAAALVGGPLGALLVWRRGRGSDDAISSAWWMLLCSIVTSIFVLSLPDLDAVSAGAVAAALHVCFWAYTGHSSTAVSDSVPEEIRSKAYAVSVVYTHLLGDAMSPVAIGALSEARGLRDALTLAAASLALASGALRAAAPAAGHSSREAQGPEAARLELAEATDEEGGALSDGNLSSLDLEVSSSEGA